MTSSNTFAPPTAGRPEPGDAPPLHVGYIDQVVGESIVPILAAQIEAIDLLLTPLTEDESLHRYEPSKWSIREVVNHITDTERIFTFRALWVARGLDPTLASFDQQTVTANAEAGAIPLASQLREFQQVRQATLSLFTHLPAAAWARSGTIHDHRVTVRALAFMTAGHLEHHLKILRERYLRR